MTLHEGQVEPKVFGLISDGIDKVIFLYKGRDMDSRLQV